MLFLSAKAETILFKCADVLAAADKVCKSFLHAFWFLLNDLIKRKVFANAS